MLKLENITKRVGNTTHLYEMSLSLAPGLSVLIGPTLAGKTTIMRLIAGLEKPSAGKIWWNDKDITLEPVQKRNVAMVYQQFINYPALSVYDNIASPLKLARVDKKEIDRRVREVAEMMHIEALLTREPQELSGGQQQRTAMARALVKDADILLFDEPLVNLDYKLREELRTEMQSIFKRRQAVVVYATTEPLEAMQLGGNAVVLESGHLLQTGHCLQVYHHPVSMKVAQVYSDPPMNMIRTRIHQGKAHWGKDVQFPQPGHMAGLPSGEYFFGVRANHLYLKRTQASDVPFSASVELAEVNGSETFVHIAHNDVSWVVQEEGVYSLALNKKLDVFVSPDRLFAYDAGGQLAAAPRGELDQPRVKNGTDST